MPVRSLGGVGRHMRRAAALIPRQRTMAEIRERPGFGCPGCGRSLAETGDRGLILGRADCCGAAIDGKLAARLLAARRVSAGG